MAIVPFPSANPTPRSPSPCPCPCPVVACPHGPGYRFKPTDSMLIVEFLDRRIKNEVLRYERKIKDIDFYAYNPEQLSQILPAFDDVWYCFTERNRKHPNGSRPNRVAREGYWKATGADRGVKVKGRTVGFKRALVFYRGKKKTNWILHEFTRATPRSPDVNRRRPNQDMKLDDWVLCRFYERKRGPNGHRDDDDDDNDDQISENSSSGSVNVGECDGVFAAVEDNMGSAMTMPGGQLMYNDINDGDRHLLSEGGNINAANVPEMAMAACQNYYINNDISDVPPTAHHAANTQLGNMYNQAPILDQSGLSGSSDSDIALPPFYATPQLQLLPQERFYGTPQPLPLPQQGFYGTPQPQPQEEFYGTPQPLPQEGFRQLQPGIPDLQHSDAGLQEASQMIPENHNAADHTSSSTLEDYFDFETYFNTWKMLI